MGVDAAYRTVLTILFSISPDSWRQGRARYCPLPNIFGCTNHRSGRTLSQPKFAPNSQATIGYHSCALVVEEINIAPPLGLDRFHEIAWLAAIPSPPPNCQAFFVSAARPEALFGPATDKLVSHNIDAMLIAETKRLPTVNGSSTFLPPGWHLESPDSPSYLSMVQAFASQNGVRGLCALDLQAVHWDTRPFADQPAAAPERYEK